jgi:hypothetical protein
MIQLSCINHKLPHGVVAFIDSGGSLNSTLRPGDEVELTFGPDHKYLVAIARVLFVQRTGVDDIPPRIVAYNQDPRGRTPEGLRTVLGFATPVGEVSVALLDVFEIPNRDESPRYQTPHVQEPGPDSILPVGLCAPTTPFEFPKIDTPGRKAVADLAKKLADPGPTCTWAHQSEDDIIGDMGDRLREEDKPGPHNVLTEAELDAARDQHFEEEHEIDDAVLENDSRIADEVNAAASEAGEVYAEDERLTQAEIDHQSDGDLTLPIDPDSHRAARPDEDDELVEAEVEEFDEDYDDDLDDWDDDDLDDSELEDLMGDFPEPKAN